MTHPEMPRKHPGLLEQLASRRNFRTITENLIIWTDGASTTNENIRRLF